MFDLISEYWILLSFAAAFGVGTAWWILSSRRHVELPRIEIGHTATQTLARTVASRASLDGTSFPPLPFPVNTDHDVHPDDLLRIKGVGPKLARILIDMGITHYCQIAIWSPSDIAAVDDRLGVFSGRIARDNWVEQARLLDAGDLAGFEAKFGKILGVGL
jgi:predicted flap endonuclease-1-like 5' DNA nuclease